jgi:hypothetical protein
MAGVTADTADDVGSEVLLLGTVVLAMSDLAAVLAGLVLIIAQGAVQGSKLTQLVALELVLALRNRRSLDDSSARVCLAWRGGRRTYRLNNIVDQLLGLVHLFLGVGHDEAVEILFLVAGVGGIRAALALLHGAFSANGNLGAGFCFHFLESVATRSDK